MLLHKIYNKNNILKILKLLKISDVFFADQLGQITLLYCADDLPLGITQSSERIAMETLASGRMQI